MTLAARATIVNVIHLADAKFAHVKQMVVLYAQFSYFNFEQQKYKY